MLRRDGESIVVDISGQRISIIIEDHAVQQNIPEERRLQLCHSKTEVFAKRLNFSRRYTGISEHLKNFNF
jgi:hypothetical protein